MKPETRMLANAKERPRMAADFDLGPYDAQLTSLDNWCRHFWQQAQFPHFTIHGVQHSERIIKRLHAWLGSTLALAPHEAFILVSAAYLHDIGMQCHQRRLLESIAGIPPDDVALVLAPTGLEAVRKSHAALSAALVRDACHAPADRLYSEIGLDCTHHPGEFNAVALISLGHTAKDPSAFPQEVTDEYKVPAGTTRLLLLQHLLRIGDALDATADRINHRLSVQAWSVLSDTDRFHMLKHQYVAHIGMPAVGCFEFTYTMPDSEKPYYEDVRLCAESHLQRHIKDAGEYLGQKGVALFRINSKLSPNDPVLPFCMTEGARVVLAAEARTVRALQGGHAPRGTRGGTRARRRRAALRPSRGEVEVAIRAGQEWLRSTVVHWGPRERSSDRRIANCAEGVVALSSGPSEPGDERPLQEAAAAIASHASVRGLQSITVSRETVHCTAMGLYALTRLARAGVPLEGIVGRDLQGQLAQALGEALGPDGWAFRNDASHDPSLVRLFSSLWAVRALRASGLSRETALQGLERLRARRPTCEFGFHPFDDEPRASMMSLLVLALLEGGVEDLEPSDRDIVHAIARKLLRWRDTRLVETEEYLVGPGMVMEKLSWVHVSGCLRLAAVATAVRAGVLEREASAAGVDRMASDLLLNRTPAGCIRVPELGINNDGMVIFPTAYFVEAMSAYHEVMS